MNNVVNAKSWKRSPNFFGTLGAFFTAPFGKFFEDIDIVCGNCEVKFSKVINCDTCYAICPCCGVGNKFTKKIKS